MTKDAAAPAVERKIKPVGRRDFRQREQFNMTWRMVVPADTRKEDLNKPALYALVVDLLTPHDRIDVVHQDWIAKVLVRHVEKGFDPQLVVLALKELPPLPERVYSEAPPGFRLELARDKNLWSAIRIADGAVLVTDAKSREEARRQLLDHAAMKDGGQMRHHRGPGD